jgi:hypothetical protein
MTLTRNHCMNCKQETLHSGYRCVHCKTPYQAYASKLGFEIRDCMAWEQKMRVAKGRKPCV